MNTPNIGSQIKAEESKVWAWIKANWGHFVTWLALAAPALLKHL